MNFMENCQGTLINKVLRSMVIVSEMTRGLLETIRQNDLFWSETMGLTYQMKMKIFDMADMNGHINL